MRILEPCPRIQRYLPSLSDFFQQIGDHSILPPIELDDVSLYFREKEAEQERSVREKEEKRRLEAEALQTRAGK